MYQKHHYSGIAPSHDLSWIKGEGTVSGTLTKYLKGKMTYQKEEAIFKLIDARVKSEVWHYLNIHWGLPEKSRFIKGVGQR